MENELYFKNLRHIHFIGIGGISMSALAKLCLSKGIKVSGSDKVKTKITIELERLGATINYFHKKTNITTPNLVVYTSAISENNVELIEAKNTCLTMERSKFWGAITKQFKTVIAVSGTHGKTTTTGMIYSIFSQAKLNPTTHLGGEDININGNLKIGSNDYLIIEACEYKEHFLNFNYDIAVITNIEYDHPDFFKSEKEVVGSFQKFADKAKLLIIEEKNRSFITSQSTITCSINGFANFTAKNIRHHNFRCSYNCYKNNEFFARITLNIIGKHNVYNSLFSIAVADHFGISKNNIVEGLKNFVGIKRRFEFLGKINSNFIYSDYAHHPTEICACINSIKQAHKKEVVVVFQPHTYSRTKKLMSGFISSLNLANKVILIKTYPAREKPIKKANARMLYKQLKFINPNTKYISSPTKIYDEIVEHKNAIIVFMGAGDIEDICNKVLLINKQKNSRNNKSQLTTQTNDITK